MIQVDAVKIASMQKVKALLPRIQLEPWLFARFFICCGLLY
jgi:hypothetical protein